MNNVTLFCKRIFYCDCDSEFIDNTDSINRRNHNSIIQSDYDQVGQTVKMNMKGNRKKEC